MDGLDQFNLDAMVKALQGPTPLPQPDPRRSTPIPLPQPDPRGPTFNYRLPPQLRDANLDLRQRPFSADTLPAQVLLADRGYSPSADAGMAIPPSQLAPIVPYVYGAGRNRVYHPVMARRKEDELNTLYKSLMGEQK